MELWNRYLGYHPEIHDRLYKLDKRSREKFIRKLKNERDESNFSSTLTELSFFEWFINNGFSVVLEKEYFNSTGRMFTPDFTITKNGQSIIAEVIRLNPTSKDEIRNKFENILIEELEKIKFGCWLQIDLIQEYFDESKYDIDSIVNQVKDWVIKNDSIDAELIVSDNFIFKINKVDHKLSHVCVLGNANTIDIDARRLNSSGSGFVKKTSKYSALIKDVDLPYFICIKIDFRAGIDKD